MTERVEGTKIAKVLLVDTGIAGGMRIVTRVAVVGTMNLAMSKVLASLASLVNTSSALIMASTGCWDRDWDS